MSTCIPFVFHCLPDSSKSMWSYRLNSVSDSSFRWSLSSFVTHTVGLVYVIPQVKVLGNRSRDEGGQDSELPPAIH
jgi:hypothetical protein